MTAPARVCSGAYASVHAWLQNIDGVWQNGGWQYPKTSVDSVRWTIDLPVGPTVVYSEPRGPNPIVRWIASNSESMTFNVEEIGTYTITARIYKGTVRVNGVWVPAYAEVTRTFVAESCEMEVCEGTFTPSTNFKETFGNFTVNGPARALPAPATIDYIFDGDGELKDNYYAIHYSAKLGGKNEWGDIFDHTNDGYGGMLIANSSEEPRSFYRRTVTGLCPGAKYNFSAWFINLNSLGVLNNVCENWNSNYRYAGVTFIVRNATNNAVIGQFNTNDVSMDLSINNGGDQRMTGWQQFGGTVTLGPGETNVVVEIRNNNPGGCGNDIAVDDIEFVFCAPKIYSYIDGLGVEEDQVCPGAELNVTSVIQPADYFTNPVYRWEFSKNGAPYTTVNEPGYTGVNTPVLHIGPDVLQEGDVIRYQLMVIEAGNLSGGTCYTPSNRVTISVAELPKINATRDSLCRGDSTILTATPLESPGVVGYETFTWTGPDILPWPGPGLQPKNQILIRPSVTSQYNVTGSIQYGAYVNGQPRVCTKKDSIMITVDQPPVVELGPDQLLCVNEPLTLDAGAANAGFDITWQPGNLHTQAINITAPSTAVTQEYKVNVRNGQCTVRDSVKITGAVVTPAGINAITNYCADVAPNINLRPVTPIDPGETPPHIVTWTFVGPNHGATLVTTNPVDAPNNRQLRTMPLNTPVTVRLSIQVSGTDCISTDEKTFLVESVPNAVARDLAQCTNVFTLDADPVKDTSMTGTWTVISGDVTIAPADIHNPNATATINNGPQTAMLRWTVTKNRPGSTCAPRSIDIILDFAEPPTISVDSNIDECRDGAGQFDLPWTSTNDPEQFDLEAVGANPMPGFSNITDEPLYATDGTLSIPYPAGVAPGVYTFLIRAEKMTMTGEICASESFFTVTINTPSTAPTITLPTPNICAGSSATLTINGGSLGSNAQWVWYRGNCTTGTEIARGVTSINVNPSTTTTYSVRAEGPMACGNSTCVSSTVTVYQMPVAAQAGADQEHCNNATFNMTADAPSIGGAQGTWTVVPAGIAISDIHNRNAIVTVPAGTTATLTWTITNGPCTSTPDDVVLINRNPIANNTIQQNQVLCPPNTTPAELTGTAPTGGTGAYTYQWQRSASATGTFTNIGGATGATYQPGALTVTTYYRRTVTSGACTSNSNVIEVKVAAVPEFTITDPVSACNASGKFEVQYAIISGAPNRYDLLAIPGYELPGFTDLFNQSFSGGQITINYPPTTAAGEYRFRIVMRNADGCEKADTFTTTLESLSIPAWIEITPSRICEGQTVTLTAKGGTLGSNAEWVWYQDNCGAGTSIGTGTSITFQPTETTTFAVRAESDRACKNTDCATATITVDKMPDAANAGQNQEHCNDATFIMDATVPNIGTGTWTGLTPGMTISDLHDPKATVTLPAGQTATLTWTVTNNTCTTPGDNVVLINRDEIGNNVIQQDQVICPNTQPSQLTGAGVPSGGSGTYTYEWEYSTTSATAGFTTVPSATGSIFQPPVLTQTTWYRRIVRSGTECESISNAVEITVSTVPPSVSSTPPPVTTACVSGTDYTTLFGTPTFSHPLGLALTTTYRDSTAAQTCGFTITRIWTAEDPCGRTVETRQTITVTDNTPPVFNTPLPVDMTVECSAIPVHNDLTATDACSGLITATKRQDTIRAANACPNNYQLRRVWIATDACGNEDSVIQIITVQDTRPPVFDSPAPANVTVECSAIPVQGDLTATDNCNGLVRITKRQDTIRAANACLNDYQLRRVWIARDTCGNRDSVIQIITVQDTRPPVFDSPAPANVTVECSAIPVQGDLTATDNCNGLVRITKRQDTIRAANACLNNYQLRRVWIARDTCGNRDSVIQIITVQDTRPPVFDSPAPANITVECSAIPVQGDLTATDNCNGLVRITKRQDTIRAANACLNDYQLRRVWIARDTCGNRDSVIQIITVQDTRPPVFDSPAPANITVECSAIPVQGDLTATDNCNGLVRITKRQDTIRAANACLNDYQLRRVWIARDTCGNRDSVIQIITVQDTRPPVFTTPAPANITVECSAIPVQGDLTATDNCNGLVRITKRQDTIRAANACLNNYQLRRVWIARDTCGNRDSVIQIITVQDTRPPVFDSPAPANVTVECSAIPVQGDLTATDNCNGLVRITKRQDTIRAANACLNDYQLRRVWIAHDTCGNRDSVIQIITVQDTRPPVFDSPAPANITVECSAIPVQGDLTATDNCNGLVRITKRQDTIRAANACPNNYQLRRVWIARDTCGNRDSVIQIITVQDTRPPVFDSPAPANITVECSAIPVQGDLTATDNCNGLVRITKRQDTIRAANACLNNYQLRRVWIARDTCGNRDSVIQIITVQDTRPPVFDSPAPANVTVECSAIPVQGDLTATDNCNGLVRITKRQDTIRAANACLNNYQLRRVWIARDTCGNRDSVIQIITVRDTRPPVFTTPAPANITVECSAIPAQGDLTATDNCNGLVRITKRQDTIRAANACLNNYQLRRVWIARDTCGNRDSVIQIITVQDTRPPVFTTPAPANITVECSAIPAQGDLTATDNCNGLVRITKRQDTIRAANACLNNYQLRRVWIARDTCGNRDSVIQIITVQDTRPPVFDSPAPANVTIECSAIPVQGDLTATDNCNGLVRITKRQDTIRAANACLNNYQLRRVWIARDTCGNRDSVIQIITVQDTRPPVFTTPAPANVTVECSAIPVQGDLTATDNCNGLVRITKRQDTIRAANACPNNYQLRRVWIARDTCGNRDSVIQIITVQDTRPPVFDSPAPANVTVECSAIPVQGDLTATDNCNGLVRITKRQDTIRAANACLNNYQLRRVWIARDTCGNRDSVIQIITVQDTRPPVFDSPAPANVTVECSAIPVQGDLTATDNCNGLVRITKRQDTIRAANACLNNYQLRRVWIARDTCGNRDSVIQIITVRDTRPPVFTTPAPANVTVECSAIPVQGDLTATDNCNGLVRITKRQDTIRAANACLNNYQLRRVWIARDTCGNRDSVIQIITVRDTRPPVFTTPAPANVTVECSAIPVQGDLTATDNCNGLVRITKRQDTIRAANACLNNYQLRRVWIARDTCGNRDSVIQIITVRDTRPPVFTTPAPANTTVECSAIPVQGDLTATDNCNGLVRITKRQDTIRAANACLNNYLLRRVWIARDTCGNRDSVIQIITVRDTRPPVFTTPTPANVTVECNNIPVQGNMSATDNCNGLVTMTRRQDTIRAANACLNNYQLRRVWIAADVCGNRDSVIQIVTVRDTRPPVFTTPAPANITVECSSIPVHGDLSATDNCNGLVTVTKRQDTVRAPNACRNNYQLRRVWIARDICGNRDSVIQIITVQDTRPPAFTIATPANVTVECSNIPTMPDLAATDNCSPAASVRILKNEIRQNIPGACANNYLLIRTWTALDECNNARTVTQTITVVDRTAPVFTSTIPANVTVECSNIPSAPEMTARDNCSATNRITITYNETRVNIPGACVNNYQLRRTWTATDECGNFTTAVQIITVRDTTPPVFSAPAPANITVECDAVPAQPDMTATDNCSGIVNITKAEQRIDSSCANTYRLIRTWTATDVCGNSRTITQTIIVADRTKPVFTSMIPRDTTVNCDAIPVAPVMTARDNCAPAVSITYDEQHIDNPGACANNYRLLRTWTANDGCGNMTRVLQIITVQDTTRPAFTTAIPRDTTVNCDGIPMQPVLNATDNCSTAAGVRVTRAERRENIPGTCANIYRLIRTWTAVDECGNTAIGTQVITVQDTTKPVFTLLVPADVTVECSSIPAMPTLTATDNCSQTARVTITRAERTEQIPGATCANNYRLIRTWTATDECGNSATVTQVITVTDTTAPTFTMPVPADATVDCNNIPAQPQLTATDNCSATNRITVTRAERREDIPGACVNNYRLIRTWTATDECGNARTVTQTITVQDTTRPNFTVSIPADATVECSAIPAMPDLNVTDNCTPSNRVTVVKAERREDIPGACANNYRLVRTWTATDECGNSRTVEQVLTVTDRTAPTFTVTKPADATVECDAIPVQPDLAASDNCSMANNVVVVKAERREDIPGACANNYRLIRTWTATDECGNSTTIQQVLTVADRTAPVFTTTVPADVTVDCDAIPAMPDLNATDNCSPMSLNIVKNEVRENIPGACTNNYRLIRTWIATDECGNSTTVRQVVTVEDKTAPVFTLQPPTNITVNCDEVPAAPVMTATDNCSANNVTIMYSFTKMQLSNDCINNYRLTRTWVATDECGNRATATQVITVIDTTRPVFNMAAPADTTVSCDAIPSPISISASDNCSMPGAVSVTFNQVRENIPGACASSYRLIYTWTAKDECGNTAIMRQVITVRDTTRPVIDTPPADITLSCGQAIPTGMIELNATDNCDGSFPKKVKYTVDPYTPDLCNGYIITRRWSVTDECGNAAQDVIQRIIVLPCPKPELEADVFTNCSSTPFITLKTRGRVNRPVYTLVAVTPANAVQVPITSTNPMFNVNGATSASFIVRDGLTGCVSDTMTYAINYLNMPVVNLGKDTSLCGGNGMVLDAGPANFGYNITWSTGETTQRIRVTQAGKYKVTISNGMCTAMDSIEVSVIPMPLIDIPDTTICRGQSVTLNATVDGASSYFWSTGATTPAINVSTQERFWVQVIKNGCITIDTIDVTVNPPPDITLSRDTTICPGQTVMLTVNTNAGRIQWGTGEMGNSILVSRAGTYSVSVYRDNCVVRESVRVAERPDISFDLGPDRIICPGGSIIVNATHPDASVYRWNDGDLNPVKSLSVGGTYKLGILDRYCDRYQEDSLKLTIAGPPTVNLGNDTIICKGRRHVLKANAVNATAYKWSNGATTSYIEVIEPGTYSVTVFNDCGSSTDEITIDVKECDSKPEVPNAFSPNGDGKNDLFRPVVRGPMYDYELRIFNRWGELVYLSKDQYQGWDGTYKGRPVDVGTFVWWLTYKKVTNGPAFIIKGDVTVVR
ncbi:MULTISPECIES: gliding motility-associated C-terminal domain-containing protein [Chitinophaga]|uniref:Gliding motility-associated C-terminal domain-containing protein n=1 Tax=Chitinophaga chungangae TaxID=2821488 RepID=A0ABS3YHX9_9BACT|nr:gliding motility-associated C-terminal domain-containing protein [Chitinophaga chungangae]MBO9154295.1 gliding motility-associated C-terminal domain-containing protein [Chitinophaga chungangae]